MQLEVESGDVVANPTDDDGHDLYPRDEADWQPSSKPDEIVTEMRRRNRSLMTIAALLMLGFILPMYEPSYRDGVFIFLPWEVFDKFGSRAVSPMGVMALLFVYWPLIAALTTALLIRRLWSPLRWVLLLGLGLLPLSAAVFDIERAMRFLEDLTPRGVPAAIFWMNLFGSLGVIIGCRVLSYRGRGVRAYVIGLIGAALLLGYMVLPILPEEAGTFPFVMPFVMLGFNPMLAVGVIVSTLLTIAVCVLCIFNHPGRTAQRGKATADLAMVLIYASIAAAVAIVVAATWPGLDHGMWMYICLLALKIGGWVGGLGLLMLTGIIDALLGVPKGLSIDQAAVPLDMSYPGG